ncbi:30S ribosomal protein S1 [Seminavis robusta]|uniref:30S ribosomal protein S1 n=1 Tax=Seminavis robusta TaxID=568900 RepID=A0A9N8ED47_9STRA|nr:30S ribosomal protein S1 [Seminavis robusta]|eukprot:Sro770_g199900.1 30S ribosomal protein S1 (331) ;mRNA; r:330-1322
MVVLSGSSRLVFLLLALLVALASAFVPRQPSKGVSLVSRQVAGTKIPHDIRIVFDDEDEEDNDTEEEEDSGDARKRRRARWEQLDPKYRQYLMEKGQQRAIANKKKREPVMDKKRKLMMFVKEQQRNKKKAARITRPVQPQDRRPLADIPIGSEQTGVVISLTNFGAYVDIGTDCDGLLHVSQLSTDVFVEHPRQILTPGQEITVRVRSTSPERKKMHLTMLPEEVLEQEKRDNPQDRIPLTEIQLDDELWGELKRVTDFGAYVEVGAVVDGWCHFMDHPSWDGTAHPSQFMKRGDRVRVWVADVDRTQKRLKLTANRPKHLPGPKRELY